MQLKLDLLTGSPWVLAIFMRSWLPFWKLLCLGEFTVMCSGLRLLLCRCVSYTLSSRLLPFGWLLCQGSGALWQTRGLLVEFVFFFWYCNTFLLFYCLIFAVLSSLLCVIVWSSSSVLHPDTMYCLISWLGSLLLFMLLCDLFLAIFLFVFFVWSSSSVLHPDTFWYPDLGPLFGCPLVLKSACFFFCVLIFLGLLIFRLLHSYYCVFGTCRPWCVGISFGMTVFFFCFRDFLTWCHCFNFCYHTMLPINRVSAKSGEAVVVFDTLDSAHYPTVLLCFGSNPPVSLCRG